MRETQQAMRLIVAMLDNPGYPFKLAAYEGGEQYGLRLATLVGDISTKLGLPGRFVASRADLTIKWEAP